MKIKVKGRDYAVKFEKDLISDGIKLFGRHRRIPALIEIERNQDLTDMLDTIAHELWHAYLYECGLESQCSNEELVSWLGFHLFDVMTNYFKILMSLEKVFEKNSLNHINYIEFKKLCKKMFEVK